MKFPLIYSQWRFAIIPLFLLTLIALQPQALHAQKASKCTENVVGFVDGYVVFNCNKGKATDGCKHCEIKQSDCDCAAKKYKGAKGCIDGCGKVYNISGKSGAIDDPENDGEAVNPSVHFLAGETNCRLLSEFGSYISVPVKGGPNAVALETKGTARNSRWDFKAVEQGNNMKGFYILTREANPRALMADGNNLSLRRVDQMDGKMHEKSQWNFYINGKDADGNTDYYLHPQTNPDNLVLAADGGKNQLVLVKKDSGSKNTMAAKGEGDASFRPEGQAKNWNCECIF